MVWSPATRRHDPRHEVWVGVATPGTEVAARVDAIRDALRAAGHRLVEPPAHDGRACCAQVHDGELLDFLRTAADALGGRAVRASWSARTASSRTCSRPRR